MVIKIFIINKKPDGKEGKTKEKYLLRKLWTPMILNLRLIQHDKWLVRSSWKTSWSGVHSSIKTLHSEKLLLMFYSEIENKVLQSWNVSTSHGIAVSVTEIFCWFNKQVQNLKIVYENVSCLFHSSYMQTPWVMFSEMYGGCTR